MESEQSVKPKYSDRSCHQCVSVVDKVVDKHIAQYAAYSCLDRSHSHITVHMDLDMPVGYLYNPYLKFQAQ